MRRQKTTTNPEQSVKNLTPYDVMRLQNCKSFKFRKTEMYPSIRPAVSQCNPAQTITWLSDAMVANGCGPIDPTLLDQTKESPYADSLPKSGSRKSEPEEFPCRDKKRKLHTQLLKDPQMAEDWSKLTPYELIRMHNCKTHIYQKSETYPSIRPPIYRCSVTKTAEALVDAFEDNCCGRLFDMEQDDIMEVWKESPHKNTLSFYGVGDDIPQPEAIVYNRVVSMCLNKVKSKKVKDENLPKSTNPNLNKNLRSYGGQVLNRSLLAVKLSKMPTLREKLNPKEAIKYYHCPKFYKNPEKPFIQNPPKTIPEKPAAQTKSKSKEKHIICDMKCGIAENKCTELEWKKYKGDPGPYDKAFKKEQEEEKVEKIKPEPKNYDELYKELITCFEVAQDKDPLSELYKKCCKDPKQDEDETFGGAGHHGGAGGAGGGAGGKKHGHGGTDSSRSSRKDKDKSDGKDDTEREQNKDNVTDKDKEKNRDKLNDTEKNKEKGKDKEKLDKDKSDKRKPGKKGSEASVDSDRPSGKKKKPGKDKSGKGKSDKDKEKSDEDKTNQDKTGKGKSDKDKGKFKYDEEADNETKNKKDKDKGKDKTEKDKSKKPVGEDITGDKSTGVFDSDDETTKTPKPKLRDDNTDISENTQPAEVSDILETDQPESGEKKPKDKHHKGKGKEKGKKPKLIESFHKPRLPKPHSHKPHEKKGKKPPSDKEPQKDCPCEICEFMKRRFLEPDSPLIREMKQKEKRRKLLIYYKQMCHRQNNKCTAPEYRAPLHKCDPIECDDTFCTNPKLGEYSDCLDAMQRLQKLLGSKHRIVDNELVFNLEDLKRRICRRFCECL